MPDALTLRQLDVLRFVEGFIADHHYAPAQREIGAALGIKSNNGVADHLKALRRKGWVDWVDGTPRTLRVLADSSTADLRESEMTDDELDAVIDDINAELASGG